MTFVTYLKAIRAICDPTLATNLARGIYPIGILALCTSAVRCLLSTSLRFSLIMLQVERALRLFLDGTLNKVLMSSRKGGWFSALNWSTRTAEYIEGIQDEVTDEDWKSIIDCATAYSQASNSIPTLARRSGNNSDIDDGEESAIENCHSDIEMEEEWYDTEAEAWGF